jgi:hypothetical protein
VGEMTTPSTQLGVEGDMRHRKLNLFIEFSNQKLIRTIHSFLLYGGPQSLPNFLRGHKY